MVENNCQINTGLASCGEVQPNCPIPTVSYKSKYRYYSFTDIPVRNLNTGELEAPTLVKTIHTPDLIWELWDLPIEQASAVIVRNRSFAAELARNRVLRENEQLIQLQVHKKLPPPIPFPIQRVEAPSGRATLLSKRA